MRVNNSYLLGLYGMDSATAGSWGSSATSPAIKSQPTAPWSGSVADKQPTQSELLRKALSGSRFVNEGSNKLDLNTKNSSEYKTLFALNTGLQMLEALAQRASSKSVLKSEAAQLQKRFDAGMKELSNYLATAGANVKTVRLVNGESETRTQSTLQVPRDNHVYKTGALHSGSLTEAVEAFQGDVKFNISVRTLSGTRTIGIDLANMGETPRTLDAVIGHINSQLEGAGVETRFSRQEIAGEERTMAIGNRTITLPGTGSSWGMTITGSSVETVGFEAVTTSQSVSVVQKTSGGVYQALKFDPNSEGQIGIGETNFVNGRTNQSTLPEGISAVRASAATADGGMWVVADVTAGIGGQTVRGQSDVVLMKLDSAGQVVVTRGIGAATNGAGYALSVSDDGRVAVAGSVTGGLIPGQSVSDKSMSDSFVSVFDANGTEQWTYSRGARAADEATSVSFGADGNIYVSGRSQSAMPGTTSTGGWDSYVQVFGESQTTSLSPKTGVSLGTTQFGTSGDDNVQAMTVDGDNLYTAGIENGSFVVRQFRIGAGGAPELLATRNLGSAQQGGEIAGIAVSDGKLIISGATQNTGLNAGTVTRAHAGGTDAFVASLSTDLAASSSDRLTYYGTAGEDTAADIKIVDGEVWLTGNWEGSRTAKDTDPTKAYLARIDAETGAVGWSQTWTGTKEQAAPMTLTVNNNGSSVLDRLGLPSGELVQDVSQKLVETTGLRAGDRFYVTNPISGRKTAVTIAAKDTLQTLATKIETASGRNLKVTISTDRKGAEGGADNRVMQGGSQYLSITNADGRQGAIFSAGESGRDALAGLGLMEGFVGKGDEKRKTIGIELTSSLNLYTASASETALSTIQAALRSVREAYRAMSPSAATPAKSGSGQSSAYMQSQIANYQAGLARLTA